MTEPRVRPDLDIPEAETDEQRRERLRKQADRERGRVAIRRIRAEYFAKKAGE